MNDNSFKKFQIEQTKIESVLSRQSEEVQKMEKKIKVLELENKWISEEKERFGAENTEYDFSEFNEGRMRGELNKIEEDQEILRKKVNMKVNVMHEETEIKYNALLERRRIISLDKESLLETMDKLDRLKKEALNEVFKKVSKDFGRIFSTLLPGSQSKLVPPEGKELTEGMEFRVAFHGEWIKGLSELSGGQRSLLALSFVLSLLRYKPAPVYILDEIDAALDLDHTQNIGAMIREHFPQSQFIIVSLKEGMFNNAAVLYKVSFVDGISRVDSTRLRDKITVGGVGAKAKGKGKGKRRGKNEEEKEEDIFALQ